MTLTNEEIVQELAKMDKDAEAIKEDLLTLCWFMRGSLSYDDAFILSPKERELINKLVERNLETTKDSGLPFF